MNNALLILIGFVLVAVAIGVSFVGGDSPLGPTPQPTPANPGGPDLLGPFQRSDDPEQAARDAENFGDLCESLATMIELDGRDREPQLRNGIQLDNLRVLSRYYDQMGLTYGQRYPALAETVGRYMETEVGDDGGPVSAERRARWIAAYRAIAKSAHYAAAMIDHERRG